MKKSIKPIGERVLVKRLEPEEKRVGGIVIPDTAKEKPQRGEVIAVGSGKVGKDGKRIPISVKKGDIILFGKYSGDELKIYNEDHLFLSEGDILAIL